MENTLMLTDQQRNEILKEMNRYETRSAVCIEALRLIQRDEGFVSDQAITDIAQFLSMSVTEVDSIATFYNLIFRKPVGKHVIFICDSVSCWITGSQKVKTHLQRRLQVSIGETTLDQDYTLLPIACLGQCDGAPAILVDGTPLRNATHERIDELLQSIENEDTQGKRK